MNLPAATLIGYSSRGDFFGDDIARWRTVQTVTIEGLMEVNVTLGYESQALGNPVSVNGVGVNNSRLISIEYPASDTMSEAWDGKKKYIATYEVFIVPSSNSGTFFGVTFNDLKSLEEFSEEISFELAEDNTYSATIDLNVKYSSDEGGSYSTGGGAGGSSAEVTAGRESASGIAAAKVLRNAMWASTPASIPGSLAYHGVNIWTATGHWYQTEVYDTKNYNCSFSAQRRLLSSVDNTNAYMGKINNSLTFGDNGFITVTEDGEIHGQRTTGTPAGSSPSMEMDNARAGSVIELAASYNRCAAFLTQYGASLDPAGGATIPGLISQYTERTTSNDEQAGKITYSTSYTNDPAFNNSGYVFRSTISKTKEGGQGGEFDGFAEEAEIVKFARGGINTDTAGADGNTASFLHGALIAKQSTTWSRIIAAFPEISTGNYRPYTQLETKVSYKPAGKSLSYSTKFSGNRALAPFNWNVSGADHRNLNGVDIQKLEKELSTTVGVTKKEWYNPPNNPIAGRGNLGGEFLHVGNDVAQASARKVTYVGQIERNKTNNALWYGTTVINTMKNLAVYLKADALKVYTEYWMAMNPIWRDKYYYSDYSWTFKSDYSFSVTIEMRYIVPIGPLSAGFPWLHSDNTQVTV